MRRTADLNFWMVQWIPTFTICMRLELAERQSICKGTETTDKGWKGQTVEEWCYEHQEPFKWSVVCGGKMFNLREGVKVRQLKI